MTDGANSHALAAPPTAGGIAEGEPKSHRRLMWFRTGQRCARAGACWPRAFGCLDRFANCFVVCGGTSRPTIFVPSSFRSAVAAHGLRRWVRFFSLTVRCSPRHAGATRASSSVLGRPHLGCPERDKTCRNFKNRSRRLGAKHDPWRSTRCDVCRSRRQFTALRWFSVVGGLPETRGRSVSSQVWPKPVSIWQRLPIWWSAPRPVPPRRRRYAAVYHRPNYWPRCCPRRLDRSDGTRTSRRPCRWPRCSNG